MKYFVVIAVMMSIMSSAALAADTNPYVKWLEGVNTDLAYVYSVSAPKSAGALRASVPILDIKLNPTSRNLTFNLDALGLVSDTTTAGIGISATVSDLSIGKFTVGVGYITSADYKWSAYATVVPIVF